MQDSMGKSAGEPIGFGSDTVRLLSDRGIGLPEPVGALPPGLAAIIAWHRPTAVGSREDGGCASIDEFFTGMHPHTEASFT